jgi:hypothetical protein
MIVNEWKNAFFQVVRQYDNASQLKQAALDERLGDWTAYLTGAVIQTCESLGWQAAAIGHELNILPIARSEYLSLDVMAFSNGQSWRFPVAVMELENSRDDERIAYSLWKVLCVRADIRIVFCYRHLSSQGSELIKHLSELVVKALPLEDRVALDGETLVVVGGRDASSTFPFGYFKWWLLDKNTGKFNVI